MPDRNGQNRGGPRQGRAGASYSNRSDLAQGPRKPSAPQVAPAGRQPYGAREQQLNSIRALPLAPKNAPSPTPQQVSGAVPNGTGATPIVLPPIDRPTERPNEPLTAGVDIGPGPGAPPLSRPSSDPVIDELRGIYLQFPNEDLRELLEDYDDGRGF